jgi:TRAP-type C4-dicarboxylate transport system permease small subunit
MDGVRRALAWLYRIEAVIAVAALSVCALLLLADVLGRELFGQGIYWAQRVGVYCATFAGLLGFVLVVDKGGHLRPTVLDGLFPEDWDPTTSRLADLISAGISLFIGVYAALFVQESFVRGERGVALETVVWPIQLVLPYAFASATVRYLTFAIFPSLRPSESGESEVAE